MSNNTGGPAFPELGNVAYNSDWQSEPGMTLRDYFAAKAVPAFLDIANQEGSDPCDEDTHEIVAKAAYSMADAMLKAREGL